MEPGSAMFSGISPMRKLQDAVQWRSLTARPDTTECPETRVACAAPRTSKPCNACSAVQHWGTGLLATQLREVGTTVKEARSALARTVLQRAGASHADANDALPRPARDASWTRGSLARLTTEY